MDTNLHANAYDDKNRHHFINHWQGFLQIPGVKNWQDNEIIKHIAGLIDKDCDQDWLDSKYF